jgi:hypothetical protein
MIILEALYDSPGGLSRLKINGLTGHASNALNPYVHDLSVKKYIRAGGGWQDGSQIIFIAPDGRAVVEKSRRSVVIEQKKEEAQIQATEEKQADKRTATRRWKIETIISVIAIGISVIALVVSILQ